MPCLFRSAAGFTLLELMLVVSIGLTITAIAVPNLVSVNTSQRLATATSTVTAKVHEARVNALKQNRPAWVHIDGAARTVQVQTTAVGGAVVEIGGTQYMPRGVTFGTGAAVATLTFDSLGRPVNPPQTIQLLYPGSGLTRTITVTATGRVTVN
jgi:prepilin-type N-terminal cleavage/methylation domain-containing protein